MKRTLAWLLTLVLCLTACSAVAETKVSFFTGKIETIDLLNEIIDGFNAANPGIVVEQEYQNDASSIIKVKFASGEVPDVMTTYEQEFVDQGKYMDLSGMNEWWERLIPSMRESCTDLKTGKQYRVCTNMTMAGFFYNKDILDEAGASVPTTWAEVQETAQKIKDKFGDDVYPWGIDMTTDEGQAAFSYYTWNNGGGFVDENGDWALNSEKNVEALNFAVGLVNDGYTNSDPANETRYDLQDMFGAGKVAMMIGPNNIPTYLSDGGYDINYDVTTIPANEGCDSVAMGVCDRLEVFKDDSAEDQEARTAAISKFFDFFYDDERYADYMVYEGFLPTTQTAADLLAKEDDTYSSWIDILQSCNFYPATKTEWADVKQGVIEVEQNALLGDDVQTLLDDLQADIAG